MPQDIGTGIGLDTGEGKPIAEISVVEFAKEIGLQPDAQGRFSFGSEHIQPAFEYAQRYNKEGRVKINGVASPAVIAALIHGAHPAEASMEVQKQDVTILEPIPTGEGSSALTWSVQTNEDYTFVEFSIPGGTFDVAKLNEVIPPEIPTDKPVIISGRGPLYLTHTVAAAYRHYRGIPAVGFYQPGNAKFGTTDKTEIGISHDEKYPVGLNFGKPGEIDQARALDTQMTQEAGLGLVNELRAAGVEAEVSPDGKRIQVKIGGKTFDLSLKAARASEDQPKQE